MRDEAGASEQRSGLGLERGRRKAKGPPWGHHGLWGTEWTLG